VRRDLLQLGLHQAAARDYFRNEFLFVRPGVATDYMDSDPPSYRSYYPARRPACADVLRQIVIDFGLACRWETSSATSAS
jgi:hypothetical protein